MNIRKLPFFIPSEDGFAAIVWEKLAGESDSGKQKK